jgi:hypothetical protein
MPNLDLPVASFRKIDSENQGLEGVHDQQSQSYGCELPVLFGCVSQPQLSLDPVNDPNMEFKRPEAYIRYIGVLIVSVGGGWD